MSVRDWLPEVAKAREAEIVGALGAVSLDAIDARVHALVARNGGDSRPGVRAAESGHQRDASAGRGRANLESADTQFIKGVA